MCAIVCLCVLVVLIGTCVYVCVRAILCVVKFMAKFGMCMRFCIYGQ